MTDSADAFTKNGYIESIADALRDSRVPGPARVGLVVANRLPRTAAILKLSLRDVQAMYDRTTA